MSKDREVLSLRRQLDSISEELTETGRAREVMLRENRRLQDDLVTMTRENQARATCQLLMLDVEVFGLHLYHICFGDWCTWNLFLYFVLSYLQLQSHLPIGRRESNIFAASTSIYIRSSDIKIWS